MSWMEREMAEQPNVLARLADRHGTIAAAIRAMLPDELRGVVLIARGSSDNAALWGRYTMELAAGRPVALAAPSLTTRYGAATDYAGWLAVAVSQSGQTPEIITVLAEAARRGARTVAVTNDTTSELADRAEVVVDIGAGFERAVPATKTFTAQVVAMAAVAEGMGPVPWTAADWAALPGAVAGMLADPAPMRTLAATLADTDALVCAGRGFLSAVAHEAALKLEETTGLAAAGWSAADLLHGPIAALGPRRPVLVFDAHGPTHADMVELRSRLAERHVAVHDVAPDLPHLAEAFVAIPAAVRAQQLALELARQRGIDPDRPFGLDKVTVTT